MIEFWWMIANTPVPATPTTRSKVPVRIFTAGTFDGETFTTAFLDRVVENFQKYQSGPNRIGFPVPTSVYISQKNPILPVIGIGHEKDQAFLRTLLDRTDLPSAGWPTSLVRRGDALYATFMGVPEDIAADMNAGLFSYCSSEFYRDYENENTGERYGPMLRRVSLLGAEVPRNKELGRLPVMVYSERRPAAGSGRIIFFSETRSMDELLQQLADLGVNTAPLVAAGLKEEALTAMLAAMQKSSPSPDPVTMTEPDPKDPKAVTCSEPNPDDPSKTAMFSEKHVRSMVATAVKGAVAEATRELQPALASLKTAAVERERSEVVSFCERMRNEGKVLPAELETVDAHGKPKPSLIDIAMSMPNTNAIITFGEKQVTPRSAFLKTIESRSPIVKFSERKAHAPLAQPQEKMTEERRRELLGHTFAGRSILAKEASKVA
jgi:hypothetical protein